MKSLASELGLTVYIILVAMRSKNASYPKGNLANALYTTSRTQLIIILYSCCTFNLLVLFKLPHHAVLRQNFKFLKAHEAEGLLAICIFLIKVSGPDTVRDRHVSLLTCKLLIRCTLDIPLQCTEQQMSEIQWKSHKNERTKFIVFKVCVKC